MDKRRLISQIVLLAGCVGMVVWLAQSGARADVPGPAARLAQPLESPPGLQPVTSTLYLPIIVNPELTKTIAVSCVNVAGNGGFEAALPGRPWTGVANTAGAIYNDPLIYTTRARTGVRSGRVGSPSVNGYWNELLQTVQLPPSAVTVTLTFWRYLDTTETSRTTAYDRFTAGLETERGIQIMPPRQIDNTSAGRGAWVQETLSLPGASAYAGQRLWVSFKGTTDSNLPSSLYVDDVQVLACSINP
jgi:hypothetical protein